MRDLKKEFAALLSEDPLGLLQVTPKVSNTITPDKRLKDAFDEINAFVAEHGREPERKDDIGERKLFSRLQALRDDSHKAQALLAYDVHRLLADYQPREVFTVDEICDHDPLGILGPDLEVQADPNEIFNLKHIPKAIDKADYVAQRKPCKDFASFKPLFDQCYARLENGNLKMTRFSGEQYIEAGKFFVVQGIMAYVAEVGEWEKKKKSKGVDARLRLIFENGNESSMLLRSLSRRLYDDDAGRMIYDPHIDIYTQDSPLPPDSKTTGCVYILRSLSSDPKISSMENLHKIGFSVQSVEERIEKAKNDPTYLMAEVMIVSVFQTYDANPQKIEHLLHTFFAQSRLDMGIVDGKGKLHKPQEWFIAPIKDIETAIRMIEDGTSTDYYFDPSTDSIESRD